MMSNTRSIKLRMSKERLRTLGRETLAGVAGGIDRPPDTIKQCKP